MKKIMTIKGISILDRIEASLSGLLTVPAWPCEEAAQNTSMLIALTWRQRIQILFQGSISGFPNFIRF